MAELASDVWSPGGGPASATIVFSIPVSPNEAPSSFKQPSDKLKSDKSDGDKEKYLISRSFRVGVSVKRGGIRACQRFDFNSQTPLSSSRIDISCQLFESTTARQSLELTLACRPPTCPERPNLVRNQCEREKPMFFPSRALPFPSPPLRRAVFARFNF